MDDNFANIRSNVLGEGLVIETPYGARRLTYADHAASGRLYRPIEQWLCTVAAPTYGNVHSETSAVAAQTNAFREEARQLIKTATGCTEDDACIFTGSGTTGAVALLANCLGLLRHPKGLHRPMRPVVLIGPYEHHSNELPYRESYCDVEVVRECEVDGVDLDDLAEKLRAPAYRSRPVIGAFSAASNVTGRLTNVPAIARLIHDAGGVAFFDYAAAGPYADIHMNGGKDPLGYADAVFLSMHKFLGGPGSPGVLLAKRRLFQNRVPATPGGGTISYVSPHHHTYLTDVEHREEGGTPNILGSIKAGLAMRLKMQTSGILDHEQDAARFLIDELAADDRVSVLGSPSAPRLGVVSFLVRYRGKLLHHNFVVALLNDLFGIQARGGNSCAAPYAHRLLKVGDQTEREIERHVEAGLHGVKPGWTRVSFGFYDSPETIGFIAACIRFIASHGHRFLADYRFNPKNGTWRHVNFEPKLLDLGSTAAPGPTAPEEIRLAYLDEALALAQRPRAPVQIVPTPFENIRWFWLPGEV